MTPPPPRSTLFPYLTLFRSAGTGIAHRHRLPGREHAAALRLIVGEALHRERLGPGAQILAQKPFERTLQRLGQPRTQVDRKSTRLKSSHVADWYAVFCLKKK